MFTNQLDTIMKTVVLLTSIAAPIRASVIYNFVGMEGNTVPALALSFQLTVPTFVNPPIGQPINFISSQLDSSTNLFSGGGNIVRFNIASPSGGSEASIFLIDSNNNSGAWTFPSGSFASAGVFTANGVIKNTGTLTVTQTPEPTTMSLALSGSCILGLTILKVRKMNSGLV